MSMPIAPGVAIAPPRQVLLCSCCREGCREVMAKFVDGKIIIYKRVHGLEHRLVLTPLDGRCIIELEPLK